MKCRITVLTVFLLFLSVSAYSQTQLDTTLSFPQVADGPTEGNTIFSAIALSNPNTGAANVTVQFYNQDGTLWTLTVNVNLPGIGRRTGNTLTFSLPPKGNVLITTAGDSPRLKAGWAKVTSNTPLAGTLQYSLEDGTANLLGQAGWGISKPVRIFQIQAYNDSFQGATGFAWANPGSSAVTIQAILVAADGTEIQRKTFVLPANSQQYGFFKDPSVFDRMPRDGFVGTAYFIASGDIAPVALLLNGPVLSGLAVVQLTAAPF